MRPLDAYLAALLAFVTVIGLLRRRALARADGAMTVLYVASTFAGAQTSLLSPLSSITIGAMVGVLVRYVAGQSNEQPDGFRIATELGRRGIPLARLERIQDPDQSHRTYLGTTRTSDQLTVHVLDRDLIASGALHTLYRLIRVRREIAPPPVLSLERVAERRSLLALAAEAADVPVPRLIAGVPCGADAIVLAYEAVAGTPLRAPTDGQLHALWAQPGPPAPAPDHPPRTHRRQDPRRPARARPASHPDRRRRLRHVTCGSAWSGPSCWPPARSWSAPSGRCAAPAPS